MRNINKKKLTETIKASEAHTELGSFETLEQGKRGIALIQINTVDDMIKRYIINSINENDFGYVVVQKNPKKPIIIYRKGYRQNAEELAKIADKYNGLLSAKATYEDSKRIGELLEYDPEDIQNYLKKNYNGKTLKEHETPSFLLKEEIILIREGNVQDYINNVLSKIKNLPYETKKKYLTIAISTLLGYTSYPIIQSLIDNSSDKDAKEITHKLMKEKDDFSVFKDGTKLRLSKRGFQHIIDEEKPKLIAYALGDGKITIGYGHAEPIGKTKLKVGQKITKEQAKKYLKEDLKTAADGVRRMFSDWKQQGKNYKITQDMFDALVSMAFNMGVSGLRQSEMVKYLKNGNYKTAGQLIKQTNINPDTFPGLEKRRYRESDMFLSYLSKPVDINV
jgi:GH24 family phage-related lysozyme (muramidase)